MTLTDAPIRPPEGVQIVPVALGVRSYDIHVGPGVLGQLGGRLTALTGQRRVVVVTDENVAKHHRDGLETGLKNAGDHRAPRYRG